MIWTAPGLQIRISVQRPKYTFLISQDCGYSPFILGRKLPNVQMSYGRYGGGGSRDFNRGFAPKPVEIGKEYEVDVTEVSRQGDGIARVQGYVIFVKNGKPGQKLKVLVNQVGARFATATTVASPAQ